MINIYVDGSYNQNTCYSGWAYLIKKDGKKYVNSGKLKDIYGSRNVTGECQAVIKSLYELEKLYKYSNIIINIYYDYQGLEYWANGKWKTNKEISKKYLNIINYFRNILKWKINFIKVKSHSGNKYNDIVDKLAKKACGVL